MEISEGPKKVIEAQFSEKLVRERLDLTRAKAQAECLIQGKMGIVSCPTLSSDYFCL